MNATQLVAWLRALAWVAIALVGLWVLTKIHYTIVIFGVASALSYMLYPVVNWLFTHSSTLLGRQLSWGASVLIVYFTLPILLGAALWVTMPAMGSQLETITQNFPHQMERLQSAVTYWQGRFDKAHLPVAVREQLQSLVTQGLNRVADLVTNFVGHVANGILSAVGWMMFLLVSLIISNFMLLTLPEMRRQFYEAVPERFREEIRQVMHEVNFVFGGFIKGTFMLSSLASLLVFGLLNGFALLAWMGVPGMVPFEYSLVLALVTLVLYPIPILGFIGLALIGALTAYFQNGTSPSYIVCVSFVLVGALTSVDRVVGPRVMSQAMGVSPLFVMFAAFAGAELLGFWGMILGVPVAAAIKVLFRYVRARFLVPQAGDLRAMLATPPTSVPELDDLRAADHVMSTVHPQSPQATEAGRTTLMQAPPERLDAPATTP